jgi:hypothetical protein
MNRHRALTYHLSLIPRVKSEGMLFPIVLYSALLTSLIFGAAASIRP